MMYLAQSILILTLFFFVYRFVFKSSVEFNSSRNTLVLGIIFAFGIPLLPLNFQAPQTEFFYVSDQLLNYASASLVSSENSTISASESFNALEWAKQNHLHLLWAVYLLGVVFMLLKLSVQAFGLMRILNSGTEKFEGGIKIIETNKNISPFSFFNRIVINPKSLNNSDLETILIHEKIHINQWHQLDVILSEILKVVLWFYPLVYAYAADIRNNLEFIADRDSVRNGLETKTYQLQLLRFSNTGVSPAMANGFSKKIVKRRIIMLNKLDMKSRSWKMVIMPILFIFSLGISVLAQQKSEKIKKVIVVTEDGERIEKSEVKVMTKKEDGTFEEVDKSKVKVTDGTPQELVEEIIIKQADGEPKMTKIRILKDSIDKSFGYSFKTDSLRKGHSIFKMQDGVIELKGEDGEVQIIDLGNLDIDEHVKLALKGVDENIKILNDKELKIIMSDSDIGFGFGFDFDDEKELLLKKLENQNELSDKETHRLKRKMKKLKREMNKLEKRMEKNGISTNLTDKTFLTQPHTWIQEHINPLTDDRIFIQDLDLLQDSDGFEVYINGEKVETKDIENLLNEIDLEDIKQIDAIKKNDSKRIKIVI